MITVFIEYKLQEAQRSAFLRELSAIQQRVAEYGGQNYRCFEGMDQPHLFVEMFEVPTAAAYEAIKRWRTEDEALGRFVVGGAAKTHVWAFCPVTNLGGIDDHDGRKKEDTRDDDQTAR